MSTGAPSPRAAHHVGRCGSYSIAERVSLLVHHLSDYARTAGSEFVQKRPELGSSEHRRDQLSKACTAAFMATGVRLRRSGAEY